MNQIENVIILKLGKSSSIPSCNTRLTASWIEKRYSHIFVCSVDIFEDASGYFQLNRVLLCTKTWLSFAFHENPELYSL